MSRVIYLTKARHHGFPIGLIGTLLNRHVDMLQTLAFHDNEHGDASAQIPPILERRVVRPLNRDLARANKPLVIHGMVISADRHHTLDIDYTAKGERSRVRIALFEPSRKAQAMERAAEAAGDVIEVAAPKRGASKKRRVVRAPAANIVQAARS